MKQMILWFHRLTQTNKKCVCVCVLKFWLCNAWFMPGMFECTVLYIWCLYFNSIALIQLQVSSSNPNSSSMWYLGAVFLANAKWFHRMCVFVQRHTDEKREWEWKKSVNNKTGKMATGFGEKKINSTHVHTRRYPNSGKCALWAWMVVCIWGWW